MKEVLSSSLNAEKAGVGRYRYGFNGQENELDFRGYGRMIGFDYSQYDTRIGRRWEIDPLSSLGAGLSPYQFAFNSPIGYNDPKGLWPWESKSVRNARSYARETGGEFNKYKKDGHTYASVTNVKATEDGNAYASVKIFKPSSVTNSKFAEAAIGLAGSKQAISGITNLLDGTGVRLANAEASSLRFLGPAATIATMPFTLSGDNPSQSERIAQSDKIMSNLLEKGDVVGLQEWVQNWNDQPRNQQNKIVFRYMSMGEFNNRISPDGAFPVAPPFNREGNLAVKWITPDIYVTSQSAKSLLALASAPDIAIWTYEVEILATKMPAGPGRYQTVKRKYGEDGGGLEATIIQPFPIHGFFPLIKR